MGKERGPGYEVQWDCVVLMKVPGGGLAFFDVDPQIFNMPVNMIWAQFTNGLAADKAVVCLDFIRSRGTSFCNVHGESFVDLVEQYACTATRFIVLDEDIRHFIKSELKIESFDDGDNDAVRELWWSLSFAVPFVVHRSSLNSTRNPQCPLPPCKGFEVLMKQYQITIPADVDRGLIICAGTLQRVEELKMGRCNTMRRACDELVPGISGMIKDNFRYVEVMAKILIPLLFEDWNPSKWSTAADPWFTPDEMKVILAKDAAAGDARKKVQGDLELFEMIEDNLHDYRNFPEFEDSALQELRSYVAKKAKRGKKRSHKRMAEQEVVLVSAEWKVQVKGKNGAV